MDDIVYNRFSSRFPGTGVFLQYGGRPTAYTFPTRTEDTR